MLYVDRALVPLARSRADAHKLLLAPVPKLTTSRTLVRESCSQITAEIADLYVLQVEALLQEESVDRASSHAAVATDDKSAVSERTPDAAATKARNLKRIAKRVIALVDQMQSLVPSLTTA